jgi:hypothetical protein
MTPFAIANSDIKLQEVILACPVQQEYNTLQYAATGMSPAEARANLFNAPCGRIWLDGFNKETRRKSSCR